MRSYKQDWDAVSQLREVSLRVPESRYSEVKQEMWNDLCSEYDATHFYKELQTSHLNFSPEFREVISAWRHDEANHAEGFLQLYARCFGAPEVTLRRRLAEREPHFESLDWFFGDEFRLCLLMAYDELATSFSYFADRKAYQEIGGERLRSWIGRVMSDEVAHYNGLIRVIQQRHRSRIGEAREVLDRVLALDLGKLSYDATFVLDHTGAPFDEVLLRGCVERILRKLENRI